MIQTTLLTAILFALAAAAAMPISIFFIARLERYDDGPAYIDVPKFLPILLAGILGLVVGLHSPLQDSLLFAPAITILTSCLLIDAETGLIPDILTIPALLVVLIAALITHNSVPFFGTIALGLPFAITAFCSKGLGMGWGDVKLVALAGALLGPGRGLLGALLACIITYLVATIRRRTAEPVAFAPALVLSFAIVLGCFS